MGQLNGRFVSERPPPDLRRLPRCHSSPISYVAAVWRPLRRFGQPLIDHIPMWYSGRAEIQRSASGRCADHQEGGTVAIRFVSRLAYDDRYMHPVRRNSKTMHVTQPEKVPTRDRAVAAFLDCGNLNCRRIEAGTLLSL